MSFEEEEIQEEERCIKILEERSLIYDEGGSVDEFCAYKFEKNKI